MNAVPVLCQTLAGPGPRLQEVKAEGREVRSVHTPGGEGGAGSRSVRDRRGCGVVLGVVSGAA